MGGVYPDFKRHLESLHPLRKNTDNPWFMKYWSRLFRCHWGR